MHTDADTPLAGRKIQHRSLVSEFIEPARPAMRTHRDRAVRAHEILAARAYG